MKKNLVFTFLFCLLASVSNAQETSNNELLKKLVEKEILTQDEADEIKSEAEKPKTETNSFKQSLGKIREGMNTPYLRFGGYGLLLYEYNQYGSAHHNLRPRLIFISMAGKLNDNFRYFILADFVLPMLFEYYGEWMPSKAFNLRGGQFKVPFTLENQISLVDLEVVANTRSVSSLAGLGYDPLTTIGTSKNGAGRDIGVQASGSLLSLKDHDLIQYAVGVFQGAGVNVPDNNNVKDFAGTAIIQPIKDLRFAAGVYAGQAYYAQGLNIGNHVRNRWGLSADYRNGRCYARSEWLHGNDAGIKEEGVNATALYYLYPNKFNLVGRVDYYNQNKATNNEIVEYTAGANYYFAPQCRFQLSYTYTDFSPQSTDRNTNSVLAQMQIVF